MDWYQINPDTGRRITVIRNDVAIKDFWTMKNGTRIFIKKGTEMDSDGLPARYFTITCYGKTETYKESKRQEMIDFYLNGMRETDGAERNRYTNIYLDLIGGKVSASDE